MMGRLEMQFLTRVWTGSCWVAASVVAVLAGGRGGSGWGGRGVLAWVWVRVWVRAGSLVLPGYLFFFFFGLCGLVLVLLLLLVVVLLLLRLVLSVGFRFWFGVGFWVGVRLEVEEDLVSEVRGHRCRVGGVQSVDLGCLGCLCGGRGASGSVACGCSFGFGRGLVDEVGGERGVGG